jgi:hypothetical protein
MSRVSVLALPAATEARAHPWVRGPAWDAAWMLSALWLAPLVLWLASGTDDPTRGSLDVLYFGFTAVLWLGHRMGSTWLAWFSTAYRALRREEPRRFVAVPLAIAVVCFALLLPDDGALPWSRGERVVGLVILDYVLVTHHFAAQHFGVLSLYRARAARAGGRSARRWDRAYALVVGGFLVVVAEVVAGTVFFVEVWIDPWLDPALVASAAGSIAAAGTALVVSATAAMLALEARAERPSLPRTLYLVGLGAMVVAAFHVRSPFVFVVLWTVQHWLVAVGLTTLVAGAEPAPPRPTPWRRAVHGVNRRPWALGLLMAAASVLLLPVLEVEAVDDSAPRYAERIFGEFAAALRTSAWVPALVAIGFTTAFWHYWLDRAVYRFRDPRVRAAARGLLVPRQ